MVIPPLNQTIAERIRAAMADAGESEVVLADATHIPRSTLRRRLAGESDWLTMEVAKVALHYGIPLVSLMSEADVA